MAPEEEEREENAENDDDLTPEEAEIKSKMDEFDEMFPTKGKSEEEDDLSDLFEDKKEDQTLRDATPEVVGEIGKILDDPRIDKGDPEADVEVLLDLPPSTGKRPPGRPRKHPKRDDVRASPSIRKSKKKVRDLFEKRELRQSTMFDNITGVEEDLSEIERLLYDVRERGENDYWYWSVHRTSPVQDAMGRKTEGFIANFPVNYDVSAIEQILARHWGGEKYKVALRNKGVIHAALTISIPGKAKLPDHKVIDRYLEGGDMGDENPKFAKEREDLIRELERTKAEKEIESRSRENESIMNMMREMQNNMQRQMDIMNQKMEQGSKKSFDMEGIATLITAMGTIVSPIGAGIIEAIRTKPTDNGNNNQLMEGMQRLNESITNNQIAEAIKAIGNKKEDPIMKQVLQTLITKAMTNDPATKALEETLPRMVKQFTTMAMELGSGGGGDSGELTGKDILNTVADVAKSTGLLGGGGAMNPAMLAAMQQQGMMPGGGAPQMMQIPAPVPQQMGGQPQPGFRQEAGQETPPQAVQQPMEQSAQEPDIYIADIVQEKALEYIQTGRSGEDFADMVDSANQDGSMFSTKLSDMMAAFPTDVCAEATMKYLANTGTSIASELLRTLQTPEGGKFFEEMVSYYKK